MKNKKIIFQPPPILISIGIIALLIFIAKINIKISEIILIMFIILSIISYIILITKYIKNKKIELLKNLLISIVITSIFILIGILPYITKGNSINISIEEILSGLLITLIYPFFTLLAILYILGLEMKTLDSIIKEKSYNQKFKLAPEVLSMIIIFTTDICLIASSIIILLKTMDCCMVMM